MVEYLFRNTSRRHQGDTQQHINPQSMLRATLKNFCEPKQLIKKYERVCMYNHKAKHRKAIISKQSRKRDSTEIAANVNQITGKWKKATKRRSNK